MSVTPYYFHGIVAPQSQIGPYELVLHVSNLHEGLEEQTSVHCPDRFFSVSLLPYCVVQLS